jgi:nickel-dependent lactate racemase
MLDGVKNALGIVGDYQDDTLTEYINEVVAFLKDAGVKEQNITIGIVARGVSDLWNYGAGEGKLSSYFMQRATQLSYK